MLCKTKQDQSQGYVSFLNGNGSIYTNHGQEVLTWYDTTPTDGYVHFEGTLNGYSSWDAVRRKTYFGTQVNEYYSNQYIYYHARVPAGTRFQVGATFSGYSGGSGSCGYTGVKMWFASEFLEWGEGALKGYPVQVENIGAQTSYILFWVGTHGERIEQAPTYQTAQSATTGSIAPGNYFGYIVLTDKNGKQYKIPYYDA